MAHYYSREQEIHIISFRPEIMKVLPWGHFLYRRRMHFHTNMFYFYCRRVFLCMHERHLWTIIQNSILTILLPLAIKKVCRWPGFYFIIKSIKFNI